MPPLISVITVCYNAQDTLEAAFESVRRQSYRPLEYVVVDNDSTDGTPGIIRRNRDIIAKTERFGERGIYEAMNRGIGLSSGEILYFLNADDRLHDAGVLGDAATAFAAAADASVLTGKVKLTNLPDPALPDERVFAYRRRQDLVLQGVNQQALFYRRAAFERVGLFETSFRIFADLDWALRAFNRGERFCAFERFVAFYNYQGRSYRQRAGTLLERYRAVGRNVPLPEFAAYAGYRCLRLARQSLGRKEH